MLGQLLDAALDGDPAPLEAGLCADSRLPGPRANLGLAHAFADVCAERAASTPGAEAVFVVLERLADDSVRRPELNPGALEFLPACAALAAGAVCAAEPASWPRGMGLLRTLAMDSRWRVRELAATGMQRMLDADWPAALTVVRGWAQDPSALLVRAAVAAVAEPPILTDAARSADAVEVARQAVDSFLAIPADVRRTDDSRTLRKALGYGLSVVAAADPGAGIALLVRLAASGDADGAWIVRENLKKNRLVRLGALLDPVRRALTA
jgi:hypothetical protein